MSSRHGADDDRVGADDRHFMLHCMGLLHKMNVYIMADTSDYVVVGLHPALAMQLIFYHVTANQQNMYLRRATTLSCPLSSYSGWPLISSTTAATCDDK